ncbi:Tetratricopeptide repeat protein [Mariniblastus fucicola]|uniref:Tetratricopeptide repeat protein n=1 Tax=Mariniblastus fucicola TaxID=980251 RepID=A0A5B9PMQ3_9BACT|nr:Tetratricopeptide repeat protein [Mariniblastus fucicola]
MLTGRILSIALLFCFNTFSIGQELSESKQLFRQGKFETVIELANQSDESNSSRKQDWIVLKSRAQLATGKYADAKLTVEEGLKALRNNVRIREVAAEVYRFNQDEARARELQTEIGELWQRSSWRYRNVEDLMAVGRFLISDGVDPKTILDQLYKPASEKYPQSPEVELAIAELALSKNDYQLAAKHFRNAIKLDDSDPESHLGLAMAFRPSDDTIASASLNRVLEINPDHVGAHLILIEQHISAESYDDAEKAIDKVLAVNPHQPEAWAYKAVLAHLSSKHDEEGRCRSEALKYWRSNPEVDHLIGLQLSKKYRFTESVEYQRRALVMDENYIPAKIQLAHDLLRLGQELEGWKLAEEVFDADQYNVVANNLVALRDNLGKFATLEEDGFVVRMAQNEADIYGQQVLELLVDAEKKLAAKYDVKIQKPVFIEIFPRQQDFAIRTFSMPGGVGFLGVCFGRVITMNSPAAQGSTLTNWKSVLWHEFCHVVTLQKTKNKMPRWLSEGISVYEEQLADESWGDRMSPEYREMILGKDLTPVSQLSSAFLKAKSAMHLQFAYFESSLVVRFIVEKFGEESLVGVLDSIGKGVPINDAISRHVGPIDLLDKRFEEFVTAAAKEYGEKFDWEKPEKPFSDVASWKAWVDDHENSFYGLIGLAAAQLKESQPDAALQTVKTFEALLPENAQESAVETIKAGAYHELQQVENETLALESVLTLDASEMDACMRLLQIHTDADDLENVKRMARLLQAINPLLKSSHRSLAMVAEKENDDELAIESLSALSTMDPLDRADTHYRLAMAQFRQQDSAAAKRNVLLALEAAPRFRDAHKLLLEIVKRKPVDLKEEDSQ